MKCLATAVKKSIKPVPYLWTCDGPRMAPWIRLTWWVCHSGMGNFFTCAPSLVHLPRRVDIEISHWLPRKSKLACNVCDPARRAHSVFMKINNNSCYHYWLPSLSNCIYLYHGVSVMGSESTPQKPQATGLGVVTHFTSWEWGVWMSRSCSLGNVQWDYVSCVPCHAKELFSWDNNSCNHLLSICWAPGTLGIYWLI